MKESPPGDGRLCFCHRPLCNSAVVSQRSAFSFILSTTPQQVLLLLLLLVLFHAAVTVDAD